MKYHWQKIGLIYKPSGRGVIKTHVTRSIPYRLSLNSLRLYFSSRDSDDRPLPSFIDIDINNPKRVLRVNKTPLLNFGRIGAFDDSGITPTCILDYRGEMLLYYVGWKRRKFNVTIEASIGLARFNRAKDCLERVFEGPILAQDKNHPLFVAAPFVLRDAGKFKMWYCSGTDWRRLANAKDPEMIYNIHYAESKNGIDWVPRAEPVIDYKFDGEIISAPWVIKDKAKYYMWYSTRGSKNKLTKRFTIGYAESDDGIKWKRLDDQVGISRSKSGWDSEMICYPAFYPYKDKMYMFYSGNDVGRGGVGYAVMENFLIGRN